MQNQSELDLDRLAEELTLRREVDKLGNICYYNEQNQYHRIHGPAVILRTGSKFWYQGDKMHRLDGPAVIQNDGLKYWFIDDTRYTEEDFNAHPLVVQHRANNVL